MNDPTGSQSFILPAAGLQLRVRQELVYLSDADIDSHELAISVMNSVEGFLNEEIVEAHYVGTRRNDDEAVHVAHAIDLLRNEFEMHLAGLRDIMYQDSPGVIATGKFHFERWLPSGDFVVLFDSTGTMRPLGLG